MGCAEPQPGPGIQSVLGPGSEGRQRGMDEEASPAQVRGGPARNNQAGVRREWLQQRERVQDCSGLGSRHRAPVLLCLLLVLPAWESGLRVPICQTGNADITSYGRWGNEWAAT